MPQFPFPMDKVKSIKRQYVSYFTRKGVQGINEDTITSDEEFRIMFRKEFISDVEKSGIMSREEAEASFDQNF